MPRKLYPMPVQELFEHPKWITLPAAGRGSLMSLCEHFWRSDCQPLPRDDDQLFAIARAHRPTWRHHKATILEVFEEIRPHLARYHHQRVTKATTINFAAARAGASSSARHALKRLEALHAPHTLTRTTPLLEPKPPTREAQNARKPPTDATRLGDRA